MSSLAKLVIIAADGARRTYALHRYPVVIGRDEGCDITIVASQHVAGRHVRVEQSLLTGLPILVDLASGAPTLFKGEQIDRHEIHDRDAFFIADVQLVFYMPMPPVADGTPYVLEVLSGPERGTTIPLGTEEITVGRRSANRVRVSMKDVSSFHARFRVVRGVPTVEDLGSRNGTFVNGFRLEPNRLQPLEAGDLVDLASMGVMVRPTVVPRWEPQEPDEGSDLESEFSNSTSSDDQLSLLPHKRNGRSSKPRIPQPIRPAPPQEPLADDVTPYLLPRPKDKPQA